MTENKHLQEEQQTRQGYTDVVALCHRPIGSFGNDVQPDPIQYYFGSLYLYYLQVPYLNYVVGGFVVGWQSQGQSMPIPLAILHARCGSHVIAASSSSFCPFSACVQPQYSCISSCSVSRSFFV